LLVVRLEEGRPLRASRRRALIGAAAAVPTALSVAPSVAAAAIVAPAPPEEPASSTFCSTVLLTPDELAAGVMSTVRCYPTLDESLSAIGVTPMGATTLASSDGAIANGGVIALHYDGDGGRGTPLSIGGTECNGGGLSFPAGHPWNDRIRSTAPRGCSTAKHWTEPDYQGATETVVGPGTGNLSGALAGRVSSVRYY
jgi:hypothetical protein